MLPHAPLCVSLAVIVCGKLLRVCPCRCRCLSPGQLFFVPLFSSFFSALASNFINHANAYRSASSNSSSRPRPRPLSLPPATVYLRGTTSRLCGSRNRARNLSAFSRKLCECENLRLHDHPQWPQFTSTAPAPLPLPLPPPRCSASLCMPFASDGASDCSHACQPVIMLMWWCSCTFWWFNSGPLQKASEQRERERVGAGGSLCIMWECCCSGYLCCRRLKWWVYLAIAAAAAAWSGKVQRCGCQEAVHQA